MPIADELRERAEHLAQRIIQCIASQLDEDRSEGAIVPISIDKLIIDALDSVRREALRLAAALIRQRIANIAAIDDCSLVIANLEREASRIEALSLSPAIPAAGGGDDDVILALWQAWHELNAIRARDGVPWWREGRSDVDPAYFSKVVDDCEAAIEKLTGGPPKPWPPQPGPGDGDGTQEVKT